MCVNAARSSFLSRSGFIGAVGAAALPLLLPEAAPAQASGLTVPLGISAANHRASDIASRSPFVHALFSQSMALAQTIRDGKLRAATIGALIDSTPYYMRNYPTLASRVALRDRLARDGFVATDAPVEGIFPPVSDVGIAQPFWSAPGSESTGHHAYPGGLCVHEIFNARVATKLSQTYDAQYFDNARDVDPDLTVAAAFHHDMMKSVVFQYRDDGTLFDELPIGGTGGHHVLSGAEAIARGHDARFLVVLLSAHAAPSLGDEAKVVTWCRAACAIAGVDPVEFGALKRAGDGFALAQPAPIEAFVSHLSDHDYVLSIHAAQTVRPMLATVAPSFGIDPANASALNWWRLEVASAASYIALYRALTNGEDAFLAAIKKAIV